MTTPEPTPAASTGFHITAAEIRKFIVAILGAASIAVTQGLIEGTTAKWVAVIIGLATAAGVFIVPNDKARGG